MTTPEPSQTNASSDTATIPAELATITVTYNPSIIELQAQLEALPASCIKVIVDNGSAVQQWEQLQALGNQFQNLHLIRSDTNLGLAAAINRGAQWLAALASPPQYLLLLDQDSEPHSGSVAVLLAAFAQLQAAGHKAGCVGPLLTDPDTGLTHGFHQSTRWRWTRAYPPAGSATPAPCANLNGSGTLVPLALFQQLGGLDAALFIDHVDTEWAFRVMAHGYSLWGIPGAVFKHSMGQASVRFWLLGWRVWPVRSPQRHYYLYRNAAMLMKRPYVPGVWKAWAAIKLLLTAVVMVMTGPSRWQQITNMWRGLRHGFQKK